MEADEDRRDAGERRPGWRRGRREGRRDVKMAAIVHNCFAVAHPLFSQVGHGSEISRQCDSVTPCYCSLKWKQHFCLAKMGHPLTQMGHVKMGHGPQNARSFCMSKCLILQRGPGGPGWPMGQGGPSPKCRVARVAHTPRKVWAPVRAMGRAWPGPVRATPSGRLRAPYPPPTEGN